MILTYTSAQNLINQTAPIYDRHDNTNYRVETNALLENLNLSDLWRTRNPTTKRNA